MRVLHVLHTSLPHVCGYSLRSDQIIALQRGMEIQPAVVTSAQQPDDRRDELLDGVGYFRTPRTRLGPSPLREIQLMRALEKRIADACEEFKPDIIHAHSPILVGLPAYRIAKRRGLPLVYEVRDLWENALVDRGRFAAGSILYRAARTLETRLLRRASAVVTIGETLRNELQTRTRTDILIAPNGADVDAFRPTGPQAEWQQKWNPGGHRVLAYIGSFQPYEGLDVLIKAMRDIVARRHDVRLLVVGDGPEKAALTALAAAEGVTDFVKFTGRVPHNQVRELYAVADVLIYPRIDTLTTRLTTPLKPLEALSMEKAVLASDLSALRELVEPDVTGLLFAAGRSDELAKAALRLLDDDQLRKRLGMAGRDAVIRSKTWKASVSRYRPLYDSLLKRSNGR